MEERPAIIAGVSEEICDVVKPAIWVEDKARMAVEERVWNWLVEREARSLGVRPAMAEMEREAIWDVERAVN